jgi:alginate O-acetyltransferase complex protein AlgI
MVFSSISFLVFFLPLALIGYLLLKGPFRLLYLLLSSLFFYYFGEQHLILVMILSVLLDYSIGLLISGGFKKDPQVLIQEGSRTLQQKVWLALSICINLCLLVYFKYFNFFVDNLLELHTAFGWDAKGLDSVIRIALPLGISFYTFQSMSYTIDVYRGVVKANRNLLQFATYVTMFPQLVAGPIVRYSEMEKQIANPAISLDRFGTGMERFVAGLAKKVLIANALAPIADQIFAFPANEISTGVAWIGILAFSGQLYFDFSGYSCMAIGLGKMLGFDFKENFNYPYVSQSVTEYWNRWHISLTSWFRDYVYFPMGGSRVSPLRVDFNVMTVFFISGLWHGTQWSNIIWGVYNGLMMLIERKWLRKVLLKWPRFFRHLYFQVAVLVGYVFFRTSSPSESISFLMTLFGLQSSENYTAIEFFSIPNIITFCAAICFSTPLMPNVLSWSKNLDRKHHFVLDLGYRLLLIFLFIVCVSDLLSGSYNPFIYFRF